MLCFFCPPPLHPEATWSAHPYSGKGERKNDRLRSRRLSTIAKRIARVGRDARNEVISWRSKARVFVRFVRWCASNDIGAERMDGFRICVSFAFCVFTRHCVLQREKEKKMRESRFVCGSRDARKTYRTREKRRGVSDASIPSRFGAVCAYLTPVASRIARVIDTTSSSLSSKTREMSP